MVQGASIDEIVVALIANRLTSPPTSCCTMCKSVLNTGSSRRC